MDLSLAKVAQIMGLTVYQVKKLKNLTIKDIYKNNTNENQLHKVLEKQYIKNWIDRKVNIEKYYITSASNLIQLFKNCHKNIEGLSKNLIKNKLIDSRIVKPVNPIVKPILSLKNFSQKNNELIGKL